MKKENILRILIKHFYGISGTFDEYQEQVINRIGNQLFIISWWLTNFSLIIVLLAKQFWSPTFFLSYAIVVLIYNILIIPLVVMMRVSNADIETGRLEVPKKEYAMAVKRAKKRGWTAGIIYTVGTLFLNASGKLSDKTHLLDIILDWKFLFPSLLGGVVFTWFMVKLSVSAIDIDKE